jgi:Fe(3+) dicitrate transport protein
MQYDFSPYMNMYGGWSQAYRPVILKDIIPTTTIEIADKNLKDAFGYNAELGFRGRWEFLKWDVTGFFVQYNNRLGTIAQTDSAGNLVIFRTNIGDSQTKGIEFFLQGDFYLSNTSALTVYTSTSYMDARYVNAEVRSGTENINIDGNKVESTPAWISRNGFTLTYKKFSITGLYSYTAESFADALNTIEPNASGSTGIVPAYSLVDANISLRLSSKLKLQCNVGNLFNVSYFTKRPQFYPGPGIWPSDGRTFSATVKMKI